MTSPADDQTPAPAPAEPTLADWIDEATAALGLEGHEVDEALVLDLARVAAHGVLRPAAPVTTYLVGLAAGLRGGDPAVVEELSARAERLAEEWAARHSAG
ncbi:DUF6457 domain-containing protein [Nocardioides sp. Leaf374]|uniref:DUF6457 domain-containing protein n=1 Tax=Nocardioides sp. Leaf374 TaxID=2876560 RepID=UPI001E49BDFB|nr:DUF6457 domain-containing protein [Nocardioides sp. Leaf374]